MKAQISFVNALASVFIASQIASVGADCFTTAPVLSVPSPYPTVHAAYNAAGPGCTVIRLTDGIYGETPIRIDKPIQLQSQGGSATILPGLSSYGIPIGYYNGPPSQGRETYGVDISIMYANWGLDLVESNVLAAASKGLRVMVQVLVTNYDSNAVAQKVSRLKSYSALCGWYLADEPDLHTDLFSANDVCMAYTQVKQLDPTRPIATAFDVGGLDSHPEYSCSLDIFMPDYYPVNMDENYNGVAYPEFGSPRLTNYYSSILVGLGKQTADRFGKTFWPVLQAYDPAGGYSSPTTNEEKYIIYSAIQAGAKGIAFFDIDDGGDASVHAEIWAQAVLAPLLAEFKLFRKTFALGETGFISTDSASTVAKLYLDNSQTPDHQYLLLLIHHGIGSVNTTVTFQNPSVSSSANIINSSDYPLPPVSQGAFQVQLRPYDVRIYRFGVQ